MLKKRTVVCSIVISILALAISSGSAYYAANTYEKASKITQQMIEEKKIEEVGKFSIYEGRVKELKHLFDTGVLSEEQVRDQLNAIVSEVNEDQVYLNYDEETLKDVEKAMNHTINELDDEKEAVSQSK